MNCIVVGLGIQGRKRKAIAGADCIATVDPVNPEADFTDVEQVPLDAYDSALVCTPDAAKLPLLTYLLSHKKHVLVEKPLVADSEQELSELKALSLSSGAVCYTAYNHRFEPNLVHLKKAIDAGRIGDVFLGRFFYGNGTAADVKASPWRDRGMGVVPDLGSHLLDLVEFLFGRPEANLELWMANRLENRAYDHAIFGCQGKTALKLETTLVSWRNSFYAEVFGTHGSAHVDCLCKWGPSTLTIRKRIFPSGRPTEERITFQQPDPTWAAEYKYFADLCRSGGTNIDTDIWINGVLKDLERQSNTTEEQEWAA